MPDTTDSTPTSGLSDNAAGALAYITIIPAIVFLVLAPYNKSSYIRFHSFQCIFLCVAAIIIDVVLGIVFAMALAFSPFLSIALWRVVELAWLVVWLICVMSALNGKRFKLPIIGALAEKQAGN